MAESLPLTDPPDADSAQTLHEVGIRCWLTGDHERALTLLNEALQYAPNDGGLLLNLGVLLLSSGQHEEALGLLQQAVLLQPGLPDAHNNLGIALRRVGRIAEATDYFQRALSLNPCFSQAYNNLGNALKDQGRIEESLVCFRQALEINPDYTEALSNLLMALQYQDGVEQATLLREHCSVGKRFSTSSTVHPPEFTANPHQLPLRVGFVSSDFRQHPVTLLLLPLLEQLNPEQFQVWCYASSLQADQWTARLQALATGGWRCIAGMPDDQAAAQIQRDGIQVLVDLNGHTAGHRLGIFGRRAAPMQVSWLGYASSTGLAEMDYLLTDVVSVACGEESGFTEQILRLPDHFFCYSPPGNAPNVEAAPFLRSGYITFGCCNNPAKITDEVIRVWGLLLQRLPGAQLLLKNRLFEDREICCTYRERFAQAGVSSERLQLLPFSSLDEYLGVYNKIDIALDPFPFSGGITSCDTLWMGVPLVTLHGATPLGRQGVGILRQIGLDNLVAGNKEEYLALAEKLACNGACLQQLRRKLRGMLLASPLCDARRFADGWSRVMMTGWWRILKKGNSADE